MESRAWGEERGCLWRGLGARKKWMDSSDILVTVGMWEGCVWRERGDNVQVCDWQGSPEMGQGRARCSG